MVEIRMRVARLIGIIRYFFTKVANFSVVRKSIAHAHLNFAA